MKRIVVIAATLALAACGRSAPLVTNGDISKHLESQGYSKVLIRDNFSCGKMGKGKHFIATKSAKVVTGQICYRKDAGKVEYVIDELGTAKGAPSATPTPSNDNAKRAFGVPNPWKTNS